MRRRSPEPTRHVRAARAAVTSSQRFHRAALTLLLALPFALAGCEREAAAPARTETAADAAPAAQWLVVNYWAEWCKPCLDEIPELNDFARENAGQARVLMVNYDGVQGETLRAQAEKLGIEAELAEQDPAAALGFERPQVLPTTYVLDPDGNLRSTLLGPQTVASLNAAIDADAAAGKGG